ncbi:PIN domain-containing protein [Peribacillus sp. Hz7]|uniref:PIN domain-containing protein n=1 Tax=Peribacillus sp. Hz7 TaxID=3344873 RepID=UPI0035CA1908
MLHVFLDSNVCFTDPFMEKNINNRLLIELAEKQLITLYMSEVVKKEVINNFEKELTKQFEEIQKYESKIKKLLRDYDRPPIEWTNTVQEYVHKLENHIEELEDYGYLEILEFDNNMLPELVERSLKRKKPFTEKKQEFRDAIIWFSYVQYVKPRVGRLGPCYFITNNTDDFTLNGEIHPDLQDDSTNFIFYKNAQEFIQNCPEVKELQKVLALVNWVEEEDFERHPNEIVDLIAWQNTIDKVFDECWDYVYNNSHRIPVDYETYDRVKLEATDITLKHGNNVKVEVVLDHVIINGYFVAETEFEVSQYNPCWEPGDDDFFYLGTDTIDLKIDFTLTINQDKKIQDFEINYIEQD